MTLWDDLKKGEDIQRKSIADFNEKVAAFWKEKSDKEEAQKQREELIIQGLKVISESQVSIFTRLQAIEKFLVEKLGK